MHERELPLEIKKELALEVHRENIKEFGLEKSSTFVDAFKRMEGMDHGPYHTEGDPAIHTKLVEFELKQYLAMTDHGLSESDQRLLRLATTLHDIGKAETQIYKLAAPRVLKALGWDDERIQSHQEQGHKFLDAQLFDIIGKLALKGIDFTYIGFRTDEDHNQLPLDLETFAAESKGTKRLIIEEPEGQELLQAAIREVIEKAGSVDLSIDQPFVAGFSEHEQRSAEMLDAVINEAGMQLSDEERSDLDFLVREHTLFLSPENLSLSKFKSLFVKEDGSIDERKLALIRAHVYADNAGRTSNVKKTKGSVVELMDKQILALKTEYEQKRAEQEKKEREAAFEREIFTEHDGKLTSYIASRGVKKGPEFGQAIGKVKRVMARLKESSPTEILAAIDELQF